ncbi:2Fe-2S iron-sulfur cluster-binding protein [Stutzerimonas stutzeri]|uniref:2Fe-2S iron-sulfur cluster-binding protein n=1 Tax=Stutzerimonas stutzeri TaxID=316 RepID=UPI0024481D40|nr:2Fe-2S iron-sulfur cluster-binding protein [Stutzerimonas stutzeri]MDH0426640.1 2Fe-2S iron-sulfur cluster-binding protein [Stutzerimonas stutzeri]
MIGATFILHDERVIEATGEAGDSLMEVATRHDVPGISGDCGGCMSCGTCHAYLDTAFAERLPPPPDANEMAMLNNVLDPTVDSRLTCQVRLVPELDGIAIRSPKPMF